ncbi:hypothetical protein [Marinicrinis sediminis]|uniref:Uncharacterized protein n=1 Tax=Marinicrinis sediminis TaxID=1652465 RepID=A0ABW5R9I3_9BACL
MLLVRLIMAGLVVLLVIGAYSVVKSVRSYMKQAKQGIEACPACEQMISVPRDVANCPKCEVKLGRNKDGSLLIRLND